MRPIDYEVIARTYDDDPIRSDVPPDARLGALAGAREGVRVLDVGCGTGLWLASQARAYPSIVVAGADPSEAMLSRAKHRLRGIQFDVAPAEALPYGDGAFDFVASRFAYHHFRDLERALDELVRVLAPGGVLHLANIAPEAMPGAWVFTWFPEATAINARYPSPERLCAALAARGLRVEHDLVRRSGAVPIEEARRIARTRDQSHLYALDDAAYAARLAALEATAERTPGATLPTESTVLRIYATR